MNEKREMFKKLSLKNVKMSKTLLEERKNFKKLLERQEKVKKRTLNLKKT
jgi:hypothetical protein